METLFFVLFARQLFDKVLIETVVQIEMKEDSLDEIVNGLRETFTESEKKEKVLLDISVESTVKTRDKTKKYFHPDTGCYPSRDFNKSIEFFHPNRSSRDPEKISFKMRNIPIIPDSEFKIYRQLASGFQPPSKIDNIQENLKAQLQFIIEFWNANIGTIQTLSKTAMKYCFLPSSSCAVERTFSYFKKTISEDRQRLVVETLKHHLSWYICHSPLPVWLVAADD